MYIKVKVTVKSKKEIFEKVNNDTFKISVKQKAERNMANLRIKEILSKELNLPLSNIRLIAGHTNPSKIFSIQK